MIRKIRENILKFDCKPLTDEEQKELIIKTRYKVIKDSAIKRNKEFNITFDVAKTYWQKPCYYCGDIIRDIGFDRVDNNNGYTLENIVPCCFECNMMKYTFSEEKFISKCKQIVDYKNHLK